MPSGTFSTLCAAVAASCLLLVQAAHAEITIENERVRMVITSDGTWRSLIDKRTGKDWCYTGQETYLVEGRINGGTDRVAAASWDGERLKIKFAKNDTELVYRVQPGPDWILFTLESVSGARPEHLTMLKAPVAITHAVGRRLNIAWNEDVAVCMMAGNMQAYASARARPDYADLRVYTQDHPGPRLEGAATALIFCPRPEVRKLLQKAAVAFGLPTNTRDGVPAKELPEAKGSYWFLSFGEKDVDEVIDYCNKTGFRQVMLSFGAWSTGAGHYPINTRNYPNGKESLKATVGKLHANGIRVGMHTFASKVKKTDSYVTPIPDKRFWKDMECTLAEGISADQTEIRVNETLDQWPGSPVCKKQTWEGGVKKHQEVIIGDEIIQYQSISPEGKYDTFMDCKRGAWKTLAAPHKASAVGYHFGVDGCINGYIIDQETDLLDEVITNLADVFNYCGFDMVYFDGGEDVDRRRFYYYATKNQAMAMSKFKKRPIIHRGTVLTHRLWHSFACSGTVDQYISTLRGYMISRGDAIDVRQVVENIDGKMKRTLVFTVGGKEITWRTVKEHIDKSVKRLIALEQDLMPAELGWFGIWPKDKYSDGLQLDEIEYLMVKSLAYDAPISLQTSFGRMESHPLTPQILQIVKVYEEMRLTGGLDKETRDKLREMGKDYILIQDDTRRDFVEVQEMPQVAGTSAVRSFVGKWNGGAVATVWHCSKDGKLTLTLDPNRLRATTFMGKPVQVVTGTGKVTIPVDNWRTTLFLDGISADEAPRLLAEGLFEERQPLKIWVQAEQFNKCHGEMARGAAAGITEPDAFGDVVVCTGRPSSRELNEWYCEYTVNLPRATRWTIWGRVRYPSGHDESFWFAPEGKDARFSETYVFGNCGVNESKWHWTGRGGGSTSVPPGSPIILELPQGPFTFRIYAREGGGSAERNPRLDCICLCDDPTYVPTDGDARATAK